MDDGTPGGAGTPGEPATPRRPSWVSAMPRLWCLRAAAAPLRGHAPAASLLALLWLGAWVALDWWQRQPAPQFAPEGIALLGWYAVGALGLALLLWRRAQPRAEFAAVLVVALGLVPWPLALMGIGSYLLVPPWFWVAAALVGAYALGYLARGLSVLTGRPQRLAALWGVVFVAGFVWASDALNAIPDVWSPAESEASAGEDELAAREVALFDQADRIDAALEGVQRDLSARPQGFFLGFAGVGDQKVFAQEIMLAGHVLAERFDIGDRSVALINDERDLDSQPIASVTGLQYALSGIADRMDLDKDVLFLAISSHGSQDPAIAVENSQFPLQNLTPGDLAAALHDAGIEWRVIILSACYAGGFIDALKDPKTIVITAAAADRTSFGCSNDSDLTYFGAAFYGEALPRATSLRAAFETAKSAIAVRERNEHETPSNPQAWFGAELEARLPALRHAGAQSAGMPLRPRRAAAARARHELSLN